MRPNNAEDGEEITRTADESTDSEEEQEEEEEEEEDSEESIPEDELFHEGGYLVNANGVQYLDEEGNPIPYDAQESESEPSSTSAQSAPAITTARRAEFEASPRLQSAFTAAQEVIGEEGMGAIDAYVEARIAHALRAQTQAGGYVSQLQSIAPALFNTHGREIADIIAGMPDGARADPTAVLGAAILPVLMQAKSTGDVSAAITTLRELLASPPSSPKQETRKAAPPPTVRIPSPRNSARSTGGTTSQGSRPARSRGAVSTVAEIFGINTEEAAQYIKRSK